MLIGGPNNLRFNLFPDPVGHFGLSGQWGVAGGAALQAVSECPRRLSAGISFQIEIQKFVLPYTLNYVLIFLIKPEESNPLSVNVSA